MKTFALVLFSLFIQEARSAVATINCSNSNGSVIWQDGYNENTVNLKYSNFIEGTLTLRPEQVNISVTEEVTIRKKSLADCGYAAQVRVFAGKAKITPARNYPNVLRSQFPENKIEADVICTHFVNEDGPCPEPIDQ